MFVPSTRIIIIIHIIIHILYRLPLVRVPGARWQQRPLHSCRRSGIILDSSENQSKKTRNNNKVMMVRLDPFITLTITTTRTMLPYWRIARIITMLLIIMTERIYCKKENPRRSLAWLPNVTSSSCRRRRRLRFRRHTPAHRKHCSTGNHHTIHEHYHYGGGTVCWNKWRPSLPCRFSYS